MGLITIKVPQQVRKTYQIASEKKAKQLIERLDSIDEKRKLRDLSDVVGIWEDRPKSAEEIARELRSASNLRSSNG